MSSKLQSEANRATEMLRGKTVSVVWRHRPGEVGVQFTDGTRLFVDQTAEGLELSITGHDEHEQEQNRSSSTPPHERLDGLLLDAMTDAFNRSLNALEAAGAIDRKKMWHAYAGVGSKYYDLVTQEMQRTIAWFRPEFEKLVSNQRGGGT